MPNPIQVILERERFHVVKEFKPSARDGKDFYAFQDERFVEHKRRLIDRIERAKSAVQRQGGIGYAKVSLRSDALAKSHRPYSIFDNETTPLIGADDLGQILVEVTAPALDHVVGKMRRAEETTRTKFDRFKNRIVPAPSREREEVGAIETFGLIGPTDRVSFSPVDAVRWLSDPATGGAYRVELFRMPPQRSQWDLLPQRLLEMYRAFVSGLLEVPGLECERLHLTNRFHRWLKVRLSASGAAAFHPFGTEGPDRAEPDALTPFDNNIERHAHLLEFLQKQQLVRNVYLAPKLERSAAIASAKPTEAAIPRRAQTRAYPLVAVVDGGIGQSLDDWVVDRRDVLAPEDREESHGTFIAGLLVGASSLNPPATVPWEGDGCDLIDVAICPNEEDPAAVATYGGVDGFLDELEQSVLRLRQKHNVRIFSVSSNTIYASAPEEYSYEAQRLDEIADMKDVIIVQSAGNLDGSARPEWDPDDEVMRNILMAVRDPTILAPAESIRNISVAALNQPGVPNSVDDAPTSYTRRGPGLRAGIKPDLAHYGGVSKAGLFSITPDGGLCRDAGTSYAAPLVAKTLAALDAKIEGDVSRETLMALLIHHAHIPGPLSRSPFRFVARDFVGFGLPTSSDEILDVPDAAITLVFAGRLGPRVQFLFDFAWPRVLTTDAGACKGYVRMTLVSTPPLDHDWKSEIARVNIEPALQQLHTKGEAQRWKGHPNKYMESVLPVQPGSYEIDRIREGLKWSPVKCYEAEFPRGVGNSSIWRLQVDALARAEYAIPNDGVPFTVLLTIRDIEDKAPVFNDMRAQLQAAGAQLVDIQTASRVTPRV